MGETFRHTCQNDEGEQVWKMISKVTNDNPVFAKDGKWFFWDELWANESGPYDTEEEANQALEQYAESL